MFDGDEFILKQAVFKFLHLHSKRPSTDPVCIAPHLTADIFSESPTVSLWGDLGVLLWQGLLYSMTNLNMTT